MTILGLNSPEIFLILSIFLVIIGTKRIEKGLYLFSKILKFLLSNQSWADQIDQNNEIEKFYKTDLENSNPAKKIKEVELVNKKIVTTDAKEAKKAKTIKAANKSKTIKATKPLKTLGVADIKNKVSPKTKTVVTQNKKKEI